MTLEQMYNEAKSLVEDRTYNIGEISEKTGLQKTANGWVKPKENKNNKQQVVANKEKIINSFKTDAENMATEQLKYKLEDLNNGKDSGYGMLEEQKKIYKAELEKRNNKGKANFDEYGLPDNATIAMKDKFLKKENVKDPDKLSNAEFNTLAKKLDSELGIGNMELAQELLVTSAENSTEKNTLNPEKKHWQERSKTERTATLIDWLDDWDENPTEKNEAAYEAIEEELKTRGVSRENRATAKEADNKERNEYYRRAYSSDSACRITADTKIRLKK